MTKATEPLGAVDSLGYLICRRCLAAGHGDGKLTPVWGEPHGSERCDWCTEILHNEGEP